MNNNTIVISADCHISWLEHSFKQIFSITTNSLFFSALQKLNCLPPAYTNPKQSKPTLILNIQVLDVNDKSIILFYYSILVVKKQSKMGQVVKT